ncbi:fructose-bisphosphatase class II, partial [Mesorhizobium sp. M7A.F.Ca.US.003.02.1.1]
MASTATWSAAFSSPRPRSLAADQVAVDAMRQELNRLSIRGTVVIG